MAGKALSVKITGDNKEFDEALRKSAAQTRDFARKQAQHAKQMQRSYDMVKSSVMGMAGALGGTAAAVALIGNSIRKNMEFEKSISGLKALTGLAGEELEYLKKQAIELGRTTTQSASQVAEAFTIIGSKTPELLKSKEALAAVTKYAIILAEAAGISVVDAANAVTGSLNQMGASAGSAESYINILAAASQAGAADIPYLNAAIERSGGTASSVGVQFHELVAAIEAIAPKVTEASQAGTYLRNIFLTLESSADKNLKPSVVGLGKALETLASKNLSATQMTKMFGKENVTAALALVKAKDKYKEYSEVIVGTNTAFEQQKINTDNVAGAIKGLESAWEGLILKMEGSNGVLKRTIELLTSGVNAWSMFGRIDEAAAETKQANYNANQKSEIDALVKEKQMQYPDKTYAEQVEIARSEYESINPQRSQAHIEKLKSRYTQNLKDGAKYQGMYDDTSWLDVKTRNDLKIKIEYTERENQKIREQVTLLEGAKTARDEYFKSLIVSGKSGKTDPDITPDPDALKKAQESEKIKQFGNDLVDEERTPIIVYPILDEWSEKKLNKWREKQERDSLLIDVKTVIDEGNDTFDADRGQDFEKAGYSANLDAVQSATGSINSMLSQTAGLLSRSGNSWGAWGLQAVGTIAQVVGQYASLLAMQMASSVAEQGKLPFPYNLAAMAATAGGIISIIASLPKFETGGIVGGNSFSGDNVLARVNSGEMILNGGQQGNLFRMLNGNNPHVQAGQVQFRISGSDLVGTLNNYSSKKSKMR